jgi:dienelactone hydrolase
MIFQRLCTFGVVSTIVALCAAGPAAKVVPADGTYQYDIRVNDVSIAKSEIVVSRRSPESFEVVETLIQGPVSVSTHARYASARLALLSYEADVRAPGGSQHTSVKPTPDGVTIEVPGQRVAIAADPTAPTMALSDNFIGTLFIIPALMQSNGAKTLTMAMLQGGSRVVASVVPDFHAERPSSVPATDANVTILRGSIHDTFWYDPATLIVSDIRSPETHSEIRLLPRGASSAATGAVTSVATAVPTALPTSVPHFRSDDVTFMSADGVTLSGTLTTPDGTRGPLPAIVLVHGSGAMDRDERIGPNAIFLQMSNALSNHRFVVLRYDKRGVGKSGGVRDSARKDLIADAAAAAAFVRSRADVDARRVFVLGHSEGGELVPTLAATDRTIAGIVLLAPPARPLWRISMQQVLASVPPDAKPAAEREELAALAAIRSGANTSPGMNWYRSSIDVDPTVDIKRVLCPILILQGEADVQVPADDLKLLVDAAEAAHRDVTSKIFAGDNHLFMKIGAQEPRTPAAAVNHYFTIPDAIDPLVLQTLTGWLDRQTAAPTT